MHVILFFLSLSLSTFAIAHADTNTHFALPGNAVIIDHSANLTFVPNEVIYFVDFGEGVTHRYFGELLKNAKVSRVHEQNKTVAPGVLWRSAVKVVIPAERFVMHYSVLYKGKERTFFLDSKIPKEFATDNQVVPTTDALRDTLLKKKELLESWELQVKTQEESLLKLRDDAAVIGNVSKIIEVKDELERTQRAIAMVDNDIEALKEFLRLAKQRATPKNYLGREGQLTRQLAELAKAAKIAESQEYTRKSRSAGELQKKLSLIEQTRDANIDELQATVAKLRAQREKLEKDARTKFSTQ